MADLRARPHRRSRVAALSAVAALASIGPLGGLVGTHGAASPGPSHRDGHQDPPQHRAVARGTGGAVSSVDPDATRIGIRVLRSGGNAVDAAVATAAALGVTEPYSSGVGGGGFFVYYDAATGRVSTIDGRETAPAAMPHDAFINPASGKPYPFTPQLVTSGVSVGVPGTPATWQTALDTWGSRTLRQVLAPATRLATRGFVVDRTFHEQTTDNRERFAAIVPTARLFLADGKAPAVGSVFRNPDLAATYRLLARKGPDAIYRGPVADQIVHLVRHPPTTAHTTLPVPPGFMAPADLRAYRVRTPAPTHVAYRGLDVYGMGPPSSGGSTVGEALNILQRYDLSSMPQARVLHLYLEASALAFADRDAYVGDPRYVDVPLRQLLSDGFAAERSCQIDPQEAATRPVAPGKPDGDYSHCGHAAGRSARVPDTEGLSTTHLSVTDRWGNIVAYTLTIEQTGGSAITVPGRGFLLNNELTDFTAVYDPADPNRIEPGKRPRSSMSPTIVLRHGTPFLTLGSPGGSTIITTVLQTLVNRIDLGMTLPQAIAAPRASDSNASEVTAEPRFIRRWGDVLEGYGHTFVTPGAPGTLAAEIGAATGIEFLPDGRLLAAAEPVRRGGGDARVVHPG